MKRAYLSFVFALAVVLSPATFLSVQGDKHPITHEDVWLMKRIGTPAVSPDGTRIDLTTGKTTPISHVNTDRAATIDWQP